VVLVDADAVERALLGIHELVDVALVALGDDGRVEQAWIDVHPHSAVPPVEVLRQLQVGHEVKPQ
jgi:hypothetical protein